MQKYFCYTTDTPNAPGMTDYKLGSEGKYFYEGASLNTVISGMKKLRGEKSFKVFKYSNVYDDSSYSLIHVEGK